MKTSDLILKIAECLALITVTHVDKGASEAEDMLRRLQLLWIQERPIIYQTKN